MTGPLNIQIAPSWRANVDRSGGPNACWPWTAACMTGGYGQTRVKMDGRWRGAGAHQVAHYLNTGRWERLRDGRVVRHLCHNRRCCNPDHLIGGSHQDNSDDRVAKKEGKRLTPLTPYILPITGTANAVFHCGSEPLRHRPLGRYELPCGGVAK